jgi:isopenicillin-N epimerase
VNPPPEPIPGARLLFSLDPAVAYLNHGSFGAVPVPVQRAQQRIRDEIEANPHRFFTSSLCERIGHARRHLSTFLGADPDSTVFVPNATAGTSLVLRSLSLRSGDEILTTDQGYGAVTLAVRNLCARTGTTHRVVPTRLSWSDSEIVAEIERAITPGRTRLIIVDHITSPTARVMPVRAIVASGRRNGVPVLIDGAHAPGTLGDPISSIGADFWVGNLHKWLFSSRPAAIMSVAAPYRERLLPAVVSWEQDSGFPYRIEMQGTIDYSSYLAAPVGLYVMRSLGIDRVRRHNAALVAYGQRVVGAALGLRSPADLPYPGSKDAAMRILPLPIGVASTPEAAIALRQRMADELRIVVAINAWRGQGYLRLSAQVYNHPDEYDRLAAELPRVLGPLH